MAYCSLYYADPFLFQSAAHHTRHLIPAPKDSQLCGLDYYTLAAMERPKHELHPQDTVYYV